MRRRQNTTAPSPHVTVYFMHFVLRAAHLAPGQHVLHLDIATGTGRCEAQRPCRRRLPWLGEAREAAWFLPSRSAALHRFDFTTGGFDFFAIFGLLLCSPTAYLRPLADLAPSRGPSNAVPRVPATASLR
jgi:hypothetical protein